MCLYYGCGLRKNEALNLKVRDYNLETSSITIWKSKNNVSRIIPLSESINKNIMILMELNSYSDNDDATNTLISYIMIDMGTYDFTI